MNFFKKISLKILAFLIIVFLSFTLAGCPSAPSAKTTEVSEETKISKLEYDKALMEFWDTFDSFLEHDEKEQAFEQEYSENVYKISSINDDMVGLSPIWEKEKLGKLSQEALDLIEEQREIIDKTRENLYNKSNIISELHGKVIEINNLYKKSLAQEIADNLRESNNLRSELLRLRERYMVIQKRKFKSVLFMSQGKLTLEESIIMMGDVEDDIKKIGERLVELKNAISALGGKTSDLVAKLLDP